MTNCQENYLHYEYNKMQVDIHSISFSKSNINSLFIFDYNIYRLYLRMVITMSEIAKAVGQRIRNYRTHKGLSQEKLAELVGCHPTYIGQLERGEKNATIETVEKISSALQISLSTLFEKLDSISDETQSIPLKCYEFIASKTKPEQEQIYRILLEIENYKYK